MALISKQLLPLVVAITQVRKWKTGIPEIQAPGVVPPRGYAIPHQNAKVCVGKRFSHFSPNAAPRTTGVQGTIRWVVENYFSWLHQQRRLLRFATSAGRHPLRLSHTRRESDMFPYLPEEFFDAHGANDSSDGSKAATFSITVKNTAPTADNMNLTVVSGQTINSSASAANRDRQDATLSFISGRGQSHGTLNFTQGVNGGSFSYTPNAGFVGSDSFTFRVLDGTIDASGHLSGKSQDATVTITVNTPTPPPPSTHPCGQPTVLIVGKSTCIVINAISVSSQLTVRMDSNSATTSVSSTDDLDLKQAKASCAIGV